MNPIRIMRTAHTEVKVICVISFSLVAVILIGSIFSPFLASVAYHIGLFRPLAGWGIIFMVVGSVCALIIAAAHATDVQVQYSHPTGFLFWESTLVYYPIWGAAQQILFFLLYAALNHVLTDDLWVKVLLVITFMFFHFPNWYLLFSPGLMILLFSLHMDRHHNLLAVAMAHGWIASVLEHYSPRAVSTSYTIWGRYQRAQAAISKLYRREMKKNGMNY